MSRKQVFADLVKPLVSKGVHHVTPIENQIPSSTYLGRGVEPKFILELAD